MDKSYWRGWAWFAGVRFRIGLAFSIVAIVLFGGVGYLSARDAHRQSEHEAAEHLQLLADRLAQRLDADMAARFRDIDQLAVLKDLLDLDPTPARWREVLERVQRSSRHYSWIGVAGRDGRVLAATQGLLESVDVHQRPWFEQGLRATQVGDVHDAKLLAAKLPAYAHGEPLRFVDVSAPLKRRGQVVGVIGAHLSWAWADERRREAMAGDVAERGIEILLVGRDGRIELGPRAPGLPLAGGPTLAALMDQARITAWSDDRRYLTAASASKPIADYPGMGWVVVVRQAEDQAMAAATALAHRLLWLSVLGALIFGAVGWLLADRLTRPLRLVAAQASSMMPPEAGPPPHDEVKQLARSLASLLADLKQREQALTLLNEQLEQRVLERTASLKQANEDLRSFSRSVSHDIQGPLGSMAGLLRQTLMLTQASVPPSVARAMGLVAQECDRLRQLSSELLTLAMVEQRELVPEPVDHAALVQEVVQQLRDSAQGVFPSVEVDALPTLPGDPLMLRQVWSNLLSNAVKFSSKVSAPRIEVRADTEGDEVVFTVADNGAGFDEARSAKLFGVFQRLHGNAQFPGTGVGLSIVRRVVNRHGGRVWAKSPPGQGARFYFTLPRVLSHQPASTSDAPPAQAAEREAAHQGELSQAD